LVNAKHGNQIRRARSTDVAGAVTEAARSTEVVDACLIVGDLILRRERRRDALTEVSGVGELVDASDRAAATDETVEVVAGLGSVSQLSS